MRITLIRYHDKENINTRLPESLNKVQGVLPPLGIAYIAASLEKAGHDVKIIDAIAMNYSKHDVKRKLIEEKPELVGVTAMTSSIRGALEACQITKECDCTVVIGGPHMEIYPEETLSYDFIDYGIIGEGEESTVELVDALEKHAPVDNIQGIAYKSNGQILVNEPRIVLDLDELPFPARHILPMKRYSSIIGLDPVTTMITSRGCPYRCGFCYKLVSDRKIRFRSVSNVVDEMEQVVKDYGVREIMFYDDTLTMRREHVVGICEEILERGLYVKWESPTRVDCVDEELLKLMSLAGCIRLRYGVESGDPAILELMRKRIDLQTIRNVFHWTKAAGIETFAYFIIAYAKEDEKTFEKTVSLAKELNPDLAMFTIATPYPKTHLYELAQEEGLVVGDYWREFTLGMQNERLPYFHPDAEEWVRKAYRSFYFRPKYICKSLLGIRSWKEVKKHFDAFKGLLGFKVIES